MSIWIEPCGCGITETKEVPREKPKEVVAYRHDRTVYPDGVHFSLLTAQTNGWDADGAPIAAELDLQ